MPPGSRPHPSATSRRAGTAGSLILVAVLAGCSAGNPAPPSGAPAGSANASPTSVHASLPPETPWQHELGNLQPDGTRSLESALRLFAMAFGPIPGVDVQRAAPGTVDSASPAVRVIRAHLASLPDDQRTAIERILDVPAEADTIEVSAAHGSDVPTVVDAAFREPPPPAPAAGRPQLASGYTDLHTDIGVEASRVQALAARDFGDIPQLRIRFHDFGLDPLITFFNPTVDGCDVIVNTDTANIDRFATRRSLTLDIVHCFQNGVLGGNAGLGGGEPAWAWDGPAEYIDLELWPGITAADQQAWYDYFLLPDEPLFERGADAIGFYAQLQSMAGLDPASMFKAVLEPGDNSGRFAAVAAASPDFLDEWASGLSRIGWTPRWIFTGPGVPGTLEANAPRQSLAIGTDTIEEVSQPAYSNHLYDVHSTADVLVFEFAGHARVGDGIEDSSELGPAYFCTTEKGCGNCPDGSKPSVARTALRDASILAVSGGTEGTTGTISGHDLEEFCNASPPPPSAMAVQVKDIRTVAGHSVTFADLLSCNGPYGHWTGAFYGIDVVTRPMDFDMGGGSGDRTITTTPGAATTAGKGILSVSGDVDVTIQDDATTMVLSGTTDVVFMGPNGPLPPDHNPFSVAYSIEPADPGRCP